VGYVVGRDGPAAGTTWLLLNGDRCRHTDVRGLPQNNPRRGLVYDGLKLASEGACAGMFEIRGTNFCTHGPDPIPPGLHLDGGQAARLQLQNGKNECVGDGVSGPRTEVIYARARDVPDRYDTLVTSIREWAAETDQIYRNSAGETPGWVKRAPVRDKSGT